MRAFFSAFLSLLLFPAVLAVPLRAQTRNYLQRPTTVGVQYMLRLPLKSDDASEQERAMEQGRKRLYEIGAKECEAILSTLASSCTLQSLNVQSNNFRQRGDDNSITLTANAQYQIELKSTEQKPADAKATASDR